MAEQFFARLIPDQPIQNITLRNCPGRKKHFSAGQGFVEVDAQSAKYLRTIHVDGETSSRGGRGPKAFEVVLRDEARKIAMHEQRLTLLKDAGQGALHQELAAGPTDAADDEESDTETDAGNAESPAVAAESPAPRAGRLGRKKG